MLDTLGLNSTEYGLYVTLIDNPRSSAAELARLCGQPHAVAGRALTKFVRRGLASRLPGRHARYVAVAPDLSLQPLLSRREDELGSARTAVRELTEAFHRALRHAHPAELVEVITGADNIASRAFALQDSAKVRVLGIDKPPYVMRANADRELRRLREGIEYRSLHDVESLRVPGKLAAIHEAAKVGGKARVLANLPLKLWMVDDAAALVPIRRSSYGIDAAFVVYPCALLDALAALFEREWARAIPLRQFTAGKSAGTPSELSVRLLGLLAAGFTDEGIARSLDLSLRTVQRRISELMHQLGATTRFQAGMAARDRGWV